MRVFVCAVAVCLLLGPASGYAIEGLSPEAKRILNPPAAVQWHTPPGAQHPRVGPLSTFWRYPGFPEHLRGADEAIDKRAENIKFFAEGGQTRAAILALPIHYRAQGFWDDIDVTIRPSSDPAFAFVNTTNQIKTRFPHAGGDLLVEAPGLGQVGRSLPSLVLTGAAGDEAVILGTHWKPGKARGETLTYSQDGATLLYAVNNLAYREGLSIPERPLVVYRAAAMDSAFTVSAAGDGSTPGQWTYDETAP